MKIKLIFYILSTLILLSCQKVSETKDIDTVFEDYYQEKLLFFPFEATAAGDHRYDDMFPNNLTKKFNNDLRAYYQKYNDLLAEFDYDKLSPEQQTSYDVLQWECNVNRKTLEYPERFLPVNQFSSLNIEVSKLASGQSYQPFQTVKDYENWLKRLDGFVVWCDTAISNMRSGIKGGYVLPRTLIVKVIPQLADFAQGPLEEHLFYKPIELLPESISADEQKRLQSAYAQMIKTQIIPVFTRLHDFFSNEYLPAGRQSSGVGDLQDGASWYHQRILYYTTTDMSGDEIFNLGKMEVQRILGQMEKVKEQVGYAGDLKSFFNYVRAKKELMPYNKAQQVLDNFEAIHQKMQPYLANLFDLVPKTPFEIRRTEAFRESSASAEYNSGSEDGSRPGIFYVPIPDVKKYNVFSDESLFLHEAIPGHHYQISLQQENKNLPSFRKFLWYSAYGEGWALYSEALGKELGLYEDPYQYFGMLSAEMHRAIRLVVDTGIHAKGWTREQAIEYSLDNEAESEASVISEIERYMVLPGQALSYKIGQLKIRELRAMAESRLANDFYIREFHNQVLESGCLPLNILEKKISKWIAAKQNQ